MNDALICSALRTPIGRIRGGLSDVRPDDLLALAIEKVVEQSGVPPEVIDDVYGGCANQAGEDNRNVTRMALLIAGLPDSVPGVTINRLCASSLEAVNQAARAIKLGEESVCIAGGVESMSRAPWSMPKPAMGYPSGNVTVYDTALGWRYPNPKLEARFPLEGMGETAENLVEKYGIGREEQDEFAFQSHQKALKAQESGAFEAEIIPVSVPQRKKDPIVVDRDEGPRADTTREKLASLKPVFRKGGSVTAGNSSTLNDGSAALLLASPEAAKAHGLKPLARVVASAAAGVDPRHMGIGPAPATRKALKLAGWSLADIELAELNEAFAAQSLAVLRELELDPAIVNVNGGAIALGHPLGQSGARILVTLIHALKARGKRRGLATLCVGVGQGVATLVELID
ncbi:MAG: thiolase family protein [Deltaproteobacteria bacterium]|nr:thiolase family protein [Deltaproteobacteria bacterium]